MTELKALPDLEEFSSPPYGVPGRMLVEIEDIDRSFRPNFRYSAYLHDYDAHSSVFWINEGVGIEYWLDELVDLDQPGWYVFEGVVGYYHRGDGWTTDDDEEWSFETCRRATPQEIVTQALYP